MTKRKWIVGTSFLLAFIGMVCLYATTLYQPLLFASADTVMRQDEWEALKPKYIGNPNLSFEEETMWLERRSLEELIMLLGQRMGIQLDEKAIDQQLATLGATPEERARKMAEMNTTEEESRNNLRRAMTAFQVKAQATKGLTIGESEVRAEYENTRDQFLVPELRNVRYLRAVKNDPVVTEAMKTATTKTFINIVNKYTNDPKGHVGGWHELVSASHLASHIGEVPAIEAFQAKLYKLVGPIYDGDWMYWVYVERIEPPYQQKYEEIRKKLSQTMFLERQSEVYREWLEKQKPTTTYVYYPDNLTRGKFAAFWHDLPTNLQLLTGLL